MHRLDLGIDDKPFEVAGILISKFDLVAAGIAGRDGCVANGLFSLHSDGLAFRAAAQTINLPPSQSGCICPGYGRHLGRGWCSLAGSWIALGARLGVQFSLHSWS